MEDQTLLPSRKNQLFKSIQENGLNPADFKWGDKDFSIYSVTGRQIGNYKCSVLKFKDLGFFEFNNNGTHFKPKFSPGAYQRTTYIIDDYKDWDFAYNVFKKWLKIIQIEYGQPDLWAEFEKYKSTIGKVVVEEINNNFSDDDVELIKVQLSSISESIKANFDLSSDKIGFIDNQIQYLVDSSRKQNIRNWRNLAIGTFMGIAANLAITSDKIPLYWQIIRDGFNSVRHLLGI